MDRTADYLNIIKKMLETYAQSPPSCGQIEMETVFDDTRRHYQLMALGWQGKRRVHGCLIHIDLRGGKVWLQHDSTDAEIARTLVDMGIPADHIVLGFHPESVRRHSGFAVN